MHSQETNPCERYGGTLQLAPINVVDPIGPYRIDRLWATGGMAALYRGTYVGPRGFTHPVAIKVSRPHTHEDQLHHEAKLLASIRESRVVDVLDVGHHLGRPYLVMEWVNGWTLKEVIRDVTQIPVSVCIDLAIQICDVLMSLQEHQCDGVATPVTHGDLKPANVILTPSGQIKLIDFGVATVEKAAWTHRYGTPCYMSPEQAGQRRIDGRSDIFSLGALLFELLVGARLFPCKNVPQLLRQLLELDQHMDCARVRNQVRKRNPLLVRIVQRCVRGRPNQRFQNPMSLREALISVRKRLIHPIGVRSWTLTRQQRTWARGLVREKTLCEA